MLKLKGTRATSASTGGDEGFGVIEIIVSMFLLGLIAIALVPILIQGLRLSVSNTTLAAATQLANRQIEQVRGVTACSGVAAATTTSTVQGIVLQASRTIGTTCPSTTTSYPLTVKVSVTVARTDTHAVLSSANTLIFVTGP